MKNENIEATPMDEARIHPLPCKAPGCPPDARYNLLLEHAGGNDDPAEIAQAGLWLEYAVEYGHRSLVAQGEHT